MSSVYKFTPGTIPVLMSIPHLGTQIPQNMAAKMTSIAGKVADTDWHLDRLYDFATDLGFSVLGAKYSRYVIDLNRDPEGRSLYPGADTTELVPTTSFAREPLYLEDENPSEQEIISRVETYWRPYHQKIAETLGEFIDRYGKALLFDCHSIRSYVPRFFEGQLSDFNVGTGAGSSCAAELTDLIRNSLQNAVDYSLAVNGRFKGGYITRCYGNPQQNIHAFQMELSQITYMLEDEPFTYLQEKAARVRPHLRAMLERASEWILK